MDMEEKNNLLEKTLVHILFWCFILFYDVVAWGEFEHNYEKNFVAHLFILPSKIFAAYFIAYVIIPKFLFTKKYIPFAIYTIACLGAGGAIQSIITSLYVYPKYNPVLLQAKPMFSLPFILIYVPGLLPSAGLLSAYVITQRSFRFQQRSQTLEKEKLAAELDFLRSQVHPHFLFNTLNNLYALTLKNAKETPEVVLKLSELLNYMLYESSIPFVSLDKELKSIRNYLALEQLRYGPRLEIIFNVKGSLENVYIAPLLLIPLIENCFKHGPEKGINEGWVEIDLTIKDHLFILKVENSKSEVPHEAIKNGSAGIGLKNVKRRLDLLYKDMYEMKVIDESDRFMVVVKISLNATNVVT